MKVHKLTEEELTRLRELKSAQDDLYVKYTDARNTYDSYRVEIAALHGDGASNYTMDETGLYMLFGQGGQYWTVEKKPAKIESTSKRKGE